MHFNFHYTFNLTKLFWPPIYCWKLLGPPPLATQNFFGPLHFAQPPHQGIYEHSLGTSSLLTYVRNWIHFQIFTSKLSISITIYDATKSRITCLTKTKGLFTLWNSQFLNKTVTYKNHTERKRIKTVIPYYSVITFVLFYTFLSVWWSF